MNVLLLSTDFKPRLGGIAQYLHDLFDELGRLHQVHVGAYGPVPDAEWRANYSAEFFRSRERRLGERFGDGVVPLRKMHSLAHRVRQRRDARALLTSALGRQAGSAVTVFIGVWDRIAHHWCVDLRRRGIPYRLFCYGAEIARPLPSRWRVRRRAAFLHAEELIPISQATAQLLQDRFGHREGVRVVRPTVRVPFDRAAIDGERLRLQRRLGVTAEDVVIATVGRLVRRKGVDVVLDVLAGLNEQLPNIRYVVGGDGPERAALMRQAATRGLRQKVHFLGCVEDRTKWGLYALADIFVMPSSALDGADWEGFGIVFLEAGAMATPAIGTRCGGIPEAVLDGKTGLLVEPGDGNELRDALARLITDPELRRKLGESARVWAEGQSTWERSVHSLLTSESLNQA